MGSRPDAESPPAAQVSARTLAAASLSGDNNAAPSGDNQAASSPSGDNHALPSGDTTTAPPTAEGGLSAGVTAGAAGGSAGVLALLAGAWVWWRCRRPDQGNIEDDADPEGWLQLPDRKKGGGKSFLPGAAAALGGCVLTGTFLATMGGGSLEGLLAAGEAVPFVGEVCKLLHKLKKHVDDFHDAEEECRRLSVRHEP
jgi:hypothetical protein